MSDEFEELRAAIKDCILTIKKCSASLEPQYAEIDKFLERCNSKRQNISKPRSEESNKLTQSDS